VHHRLRYRRYPMTIGLGTLSAPDRDAERLFLALVARNGLQRTSIRRSRGPGGRDDPLSARSLAERLLDRAGSPVNALILTGSPKGRDSSSFLLGSSWGRHCGITRVTVRDEFAHQALRTEEGTRRLLDAVDASDLLVLGVPALRRLAAGAAHAPARTRSGAKDRIRIPGGSPARRIGSSAGFPRRTSATRRSGSAGCSPGAWACDGPAPWRWAWAASSAGGSGNCPAAGGTSWRRSTGRVNRSQREATCPGRRWRFSPDACSPVAVHPVRKPGVARADAEEQGAKAVGVPSLREVMTDTPV